MITVDLKTQKLINALTDCAKVMDRDLNGLELIQPELAQAKQALEDFYLVDAEFEPWNGEGLPPVGTKVEFFNNQEWVIVEILFLTDITILIRLTDELGHQECSLHPDHCKFRPIPTPEHIAAQEREKAINEMSEASQGSHNWPDAFAKLYDAGYRKQVTP